MYGRYEYCPIYKGVAFLNNTTGTEWRGISRSSLSHAMCVATILPANPAFAKSYPIVAQPGYAPKALVSAISPDRLYAYLRTAGKQALQVMPAVKYSLEGVEVKMTGVVPRYEGLYVIEGIVRLIGDIVIKPSGRMHSMYLSVNARNADILAHQAVQVRNDFITSFRITSSISQENPTSFSISSTLNDKVLMTTTSIQLTQEGNTQKITASFIPEYHEIETRFGLTLEVQMGGEFTGKVTIYPRHPTHLDKLEHSVHSLANLEGTLTQPAADNVNASAVSQGFWFVAGTILFCVFAAA